MLPDLTCPKCKAPLPSSIVSSGAWEKCLGCDRDIEAELFPAFFQKKPSLSPQERLLMENEAACFYHQENKASVVCESCGRFICSLCDVELKGRHLCPTCVESGHKKGKIKDLQNRRVLYDDIALSLSLVPIIMVWPTILTAPISLYYAISGWKKPGSIIPRTKIRFIVAIICSSLQIIAWCGILYWLIFEQGR